MPAQARVTDMMKHDSPHCHAPIHPPAPVPTPVPHPPIPHIIIGPGAITVMVNKLPACIVTDKSIPCLTPPCIPAGPGMVAMGSMTVMITKKPAARSNDMTAWASCVAPIPSPTGKIQPPCSPTVMTGG
ncbi:MAG: putative Zn-binding protein involved in type VI secretion [Kiritimatiellia bacterium]|jgi:uncharacterized Zn-binding protein involved in type VI secretion